VVYGIWWVDGLDGFNGFGWVDGYMGGLMGRGRSYCQSLINMHFPINRRIYLISSPGQANVRSQTCCTQTQKRDNLVSLAFGQIAAR